MTSNACPHLLVALLKLMLLHICTAQKPIPPTTNITTPSEPPAPPPWIPKTPLPLDAVVKRLDAYGNIRLGNKDVYVQMIINVRLTVNKGHSLLRGFTWFDDITETRFHFFGFWTQIPDLAGITFNLVFTNYATGNVQKVAIWQHQHPYRPSGFTLEFKEEVECVQVHLEQAPHLGGETCFTYTGACPIPTLDNLGRKKAVWNVIPPVHGSEPGEYTLYRAMLVHHLRYHLHVGFTGAIVFMDDYGMKALMEDPSLTPYLERGQLLMVTWPLVEQKKLRHMIRTWDYALVANHALVMTYDCKAWLAPTDYSDYFILAPKPDPTSSQLTRDVQAAFSSCIAGAGAAIHTFRKYEAAISWLAKNTTELELPLWLDFNNTLHPLHHYDLMGVKDETTEHQLVNAKGLVYSYFTSDGWPGAGYINVVPPSCAGWVTLPNLHKVQTRPDGHYEEWKGPGRDLIKDTKFGGQLTLLW